MNPSTLPATISAPQIQYVQADTLSTAGGEQPDLAHYLDILSANKWLIILVTSLVLAIGMAYAMFTRPVYEGNLLIQVEETEPNAKNFLAEATSMVNVKTPASSEMEILRSRMIIGQAVEMTKLYIDAHPRYLPLIGGWLARNASSLSNANLPGLSGYVYGSEKIVVPHFEVSQKLENSRFTVVAQGNGAYLLQHPHWRAPIKGMVGKDLKTETPDGQIDLLISELDGKPGAQFIINRYSRLGTIENLQARLGLVEKGKQSGVINATLQSDDRFQLANVLNAIGSLYVRQNTERKAAEAQKTLAFLDVQLPVYRRQLEESEEIYNRYRNQKGTVAFDEEAKLILGQAVDRQTKLLEAQQKRREMESRFTSDHPMMQTLDAQIAALSRDIGGVQARIKGLPAIQQDAVRMERDLKVNTTLYQSLLNNAMQLRLVKEGKVGNVRLLDEAMVPEKPIKPDPATILGMALLLGLFLGVVAAFIRSFFVEQRIRDPHALEVDTSLPVFSTIPLSPAQDVISARPAGTTSGVQLLAVEKPDDLAVESLRSLRTAMQFAMLEATNNRVMICGATPGVGKSFVTSNFAALMAAAGKRTLLVDADMRRGHLHQYLGLPRRGGLSELIAGTLSTQQAIHRDVVSNLDFLATGQLPPNPAELLISESFRQTLEKLSGDYDLIVIDTPPVLVAADAATIAAQAGTVLLVARANSSTMGELSEATRRLSLSGKAATGVLLNAMDESKRGYQAYRYGRYRYTNYSYQSLLPKA